MGADDYLVKPFSFAQMTARIKAILKRVCTQENSKPQHMQAGDLYIDLCSKVVQKSGEEIQLTPTEYRLLVALMQRPGEVISREVLMREVWGLGFDGGSGYVRRYIWHLRKKIEEDPAQPAIIVTVTGVGYAWGSRDEE